MALIFKIVPLALWQQAEQAGIFTGSPVDLADGYIHFSTNGQLAETTAKHFAGQHGLLLVAAEEERLGPGLVYEASRGGAMFPHLHGPMALGAVRWTAPLPLGADGIPQTGGLV